VGSTKPKIGALPVIYLTSNFQGVLIQSIIFPRIFTLLRQNRVEYYEKYLLTIFPTKANTPINQTIPRRIGFAIN